ncbi:MAG: hypothetical protein V9E83_12325 [Baekduia sp.]
MDVLLKLAADAGHEVTTAEQAIAGEEFEAAREALDRAGDHLAELREQWPSMSAAERSVIGGAAQAVRARLDEAAAAVPARRTLSEGAAEHDPEEDRDPIR